VRQQVSIQRYGLKTVKNNTNNEVDNEVDIQGTFAHAAKNPLSHSALLTDRQRPNMTRVMACSTEVPLESL